MRLQNSRERLPEANHADPWPQNAIESEFQKHESKHLESEDKIE